MNIENVVEKIKEHEGFRGDPYTDSLGYPTIGYGTKLPIDKREAELLLIKRLNETVSELEEYYENFESLPQTIQEVLVDMAYNMGVPRLKGFKKMWQAIEAQDWKKMAHEMVDSRWYHQVGRRSKELVNRVLEYAERVGD